ncbi:MULTISPECIES: DUF4280 domain-containing protein [unclassified Flavobacterium]|uniref:DUF4280 domain-containing protein n=1 Tax=unclassified Flavobacterium TaxID=196869 RepID=UPI000F0C871E|nr:MULTISPECIES: DUF4280 domain-containing protein [unclassified Flavobacterium]AYN05792.1 DUF4280 domain-containing protein [Flavobacterium sp. 140616W15]MCD0475731.1 DUF4280 domain-containing protein [Flavobacterium sp. EDS]
MATKYVCNGAICACDQGTAPRALDVKSQSNIFIQEKLMATDSEKTFESLFFGNCKLRQNNLCIPDIKTKWKDPANNVFEGDKKALLENSTLKCEVGGNIKIIDPLQTEPKIVILDNYSPPVITPLTKEILNVTWKNGNLDREIDTANIGDKVSLVVETKNYKEGETVVVIIDEIDGKDVKENTKQVKFTGEVNTDGFAILKEEIAIENVN